MTDLERHMRAPEPEGHAVLPEAIAMVLGSKHGKQALVGLHHWEHDDQATGHTHEGSSL